MQLLIVAFSALFAAASSASPAPVAAQSSVAANAPADNEVAAEAHRTYQHGLKQSLHNSMSPRDWALASVIFEINDLNTDAAKHEHGTLLRKAAEAALNDRLVQAYWANASPDFSGCDAQHPCADRVSAWATLEPDNGAAWVSVVNAALQSNDGPGTEAALAHMSVASRYDEVYIEAVMAWLDIERRYPEPMAEPRDKTRPEATDAVATAFAYASAFSIPAYALFVRTCDRAKNPQASAAHFENCGRIGRLMLARSNTVIAQHIGLAVLRVSRTASADDQAAARVFDWQRDQSMEHARAFESDPAALRLYIADLEQTRSEVEAQQRQLRRAGIPLTPPVNWQPTRNGKPISPLGVSPAPAKQP
jgi:hypothetical protein